VPYADGFADNSIADARKQAEAIVADLKANQVETSADKEIIALIAYLQRLGTDIKVSSGSGENNSESVQ